MPATATPSPGTSPRASRSIAHSSSRAPERGGAEWAYVAASRQRHDLQVFVVHHEAEDVEEALGRAWSRSQAKSLALDAVDPVDQSAAMDAVRGDLSAATPERLVARAEELRAAREVAREAAGSVPNRELARVAELRAVLDRAEGGVREAEARRAGLAERLDRIPAWRRRERSEVRAGLASAADDVERHREEGRAAREELARVRRQRARVGAGAERGAVRDRSPARCLEGRARGRASPIGRRPSP